MSIITQCTPNQGNEFLFAQQVVDWLESAFPGWGWTALLDGGVLYIKNESLSADWGMQKSAFQLNKAWVINAGGEILERFSMPYAFKDSALADGKKDFSGKFVSEKWTPDRRYYNKNEQRWKA